ncbi:MAG TPA: M50 family metallopeptidase [Solirubrobacterales bacterium]|nr:M50 family metallopeptidase [Solirubrobacterales bacterium]
MSWFLAFAGFAALIILHEFGHFVAAKRTGMRVEKFYLFFPPAIAKVKRGETEYGVGAVPLGGYVKITGMNPDEVRVPESVPGRAPAARPGLVTAMDSGGQGSPPHAARTVLPPEILKRAYYNQPVWKRIVVIAAGPAMNLLIAFLVLFALAFGIQEATSQIGKVENDSPASGKLRPGDTIAAVDGASITGSPEDRFNAVREAIANHECAGEPTDGCRAETPALITVDRDGHSKQLSIRPFYDADIDRYRIGFAPGTRPLDPTPPEAAGQALDIMWQVTSGTVSTIAGIFQADKRDDISGVVGSYEVTRQAIEFSARDALFLLAIISLSLAIINLFPFLPLDGGHIFWSLVEKVRGRPVAFSTMERAGVLGAMLIVMLFFIGLSNDVGRLMGQGFDVR